MPKQQKDSGPTTILRFSADHLWVRADADRAQIGISDYGQGGIGEIIAIELPAVGDQIEKGEQFGEIESVRSLHELCAPMTGTVVAVNGELEDNPSLANEDPYHEGWLIEVTLSDDQDLETLMAVDDYEDFVARSQDED